MTILVQCTENCSNKAWLSLQAAIDCICSGDDAGADGLTVGITWKRTRYYTVYKSTILGSREFEGRVFSDRLDVRSDGVVGIQVEGNRLNVG
jgi:hypothetical protein